MPIIFIPEKNVEKHMQTIEALIHLAIEDCDFELTEAGVDLMGDFFGLKGLLFGKAKCEKRLEDLQDKLKGNNMTEELSEKEPNINEVLGKIRAEIEQKARPNEIGGRGCGKSIRYGLCMALEIIDKYKGV